MIRYKYKIKTKQEFIDEFGENWINISGMYWNRSGMMDYLFGTEIDPIYYKEYLNDIGKLDIDNWIEVPNTNTSYNIQSWCINEKMIKEVKIGVDYNSPKKLVYD